ncbi:hypothetical protein C8R43DRAFT_880825, partial [Mycena crocata]
LFLTGHPQRSTHMLRRQKSEHVPVLSGTHIPRRDLEDQATRYANIMLALFQPWKRSPTNPLKSDTTTWLDALQELLSSLPQSKLDIIDHMQERWECHLAADDFSAQYKARQAELNASNGISCQIDASEELANDLNWQLGQLDKAVGPS